MLSEQETQLLGELLADNNVTDESIRGNITIDSVLALVLFLAFCILQRSSILYRFRPWSHSVTHKPPPLSNTWTGVFDWITVTWKTRDREFLQSCGLDALMMVKACTLGLWLFLPPAVVGIAVLLPIHYHGGGNRVVRSHRTAGEYTSSFLQLTIGNVATGSSLLWVHVALIHVFIAYACWLLRGYYRQYLLIRQHMLSAGENVNQWRWVYAMEQQPVASRGLAALQDMLRPPPLIRGFTSVQDCMDSEPYSSMTCGSPTAYTGPSLVTKSMRVSQQGSGAAAGALEMAQVDLRPVNIASVNGAHHNSVAPAHEQQHMGDRPSGGSTQAKEAPDSPTPLLAKKNTTFESSGHVDAGGGSHDNMAAKLGVINRFMLRQATSMPNGVLAARQAVNTSPRGTVVNFHPAAAIMEAPPVQNLAASPVRKSHDRNTAASGIVRRSEGGDHCHIEASPRKSRNLVPCTAGRFLMHNKSSLAGHAGPGDSISARRRDMQQLQERILAELDQDSRVSSNGAAAAMSPKPPAELRSIVVTSDSKKNAAPGMGAKVSTLRPSSNSVPLSGSSGLIKAGRTLTDRQRQSQAVHPEPVSTSPFHTAVSLAASAVSQHAQYEHQDQNMDDTIPKTARDVIPGTSSTSLLLPCNDSSNTVIKDTEHSTARQGYNPRAPGAVPLQQPSRSTGAHMQSRLATPATETAGIKTGVSAGSRSSVTATQSTQDEMLALPSFGSLITSHELPLPALPTSAHILGTGHNASTQPHGDVQSGRDVYMEGFQGLQKSPSLPQEPRDWQLKSTFSQGEAVPFTPPVARPGRHRRMRSDGPAYYFDGHSTDARDARAGSTTPPEQGILKQRMSLLSSAGGSTGRDRAASMHRSAISVQMLYSDSKPGEKVGCDVKDPGSSSGRAKVVRSGSADASKESNGNSKDKVDDEIDAPRWWGSIVLKPEPAATAGKARLSSLGGGARALQASSQRHRRTASRDAANGGNALAAGVVTYVDNPLAVLPAGLVPHARGSPVDSQAGVSTLSRAGSEQQHKQQQQLDGVSSSDGPPLQETMSREALLHATWSQPPQEVLDAFDTSLDQQQLDGGHVDDDNDYTSEYEVKQLDLLAMPSVRARKTINTVMDTDQGPQTIAVNAEYYVVLVTDVMQPMYPEQGMKRWHRMPRCTHSPRVSLSGAAAAAVPPRSTHRPARGSSNDIEPNRSSSQSIKDSVSGHDGVHHRHPHGHHGQNKHPGSNQEALLRKSLNNIGNTLLNVNATLGIGRGHSRSGYIHAQSDDATPLVAKSQNGLSSSDVAHPQAIQISIDASSAVATAAGADGHDQQHAGGGSHAQGASSAAASNTMDLPVEQQLRQRAQDLWDRARDHVMSGRVRLLLLSRHYSLVTSTFKSLFPDDFDRAIPVIKHKDIDMLLRKQDLYLAAYDQALLYEAKTGKKLKKRLGWCGLFGRKVDSAVHHKQKLRELCDEVKAARAKALLSGATPSWFVFFKSQMAAAIATSAPLTSEDNRQFRVRPAPGPDEVNWATLWMTWRQREVRAFLVTPLMIMLILIPIGLFSGGLQQLDQAFCPLHKCNVPVVISGVNATEVKVLDPVQCAAVGGKVQGYTTFQWDWYCRREDPVARLLALVVVGWTPALLMVLWQGGLLPLGLFLLTQMSGKCYSLSEVDRQIASYLCYFGIFNVFLGGLAGSALVQSFAQLASKGPLEVFLIIGKSLPLASNFFINYLLFRTFIGLPCRLVIPHVGVRLFLARKYLRCMRHFTTRDKAVLYAPVSPRWGFEYGMLSIMFVVGCAFCVVTPLMMPLVVAFFGLSWLFWKYSLLYVYVRKYESGGLMWPFLYSRVLVCLYITSLFTACVMLSKQAYFQAIVLFVTIPIILYRFNRYCWYRFQQGINRMPLEYAARAPKAEVDPWVYIPPPIHHKALGWNPDWCKPWQGWDLPPGYATL